MRKKKSMLNILFTLVSYFVALIMNFITQACIVKILGLEYTGIEGLFSNIIKMLSVAELGIGVTIIYKLYKPIADDDKEKIKSWMNFYKICYRYIALVVLVIGLLIIPFIPKIVGEVAIKENIFLLYIISLLDVIFSYIMTYKRSLLYANQKNYIISIVHTIYLLLMNLTQILLLVLFKNYVLFLVVKVLYRLFENIIINMYVNNNYPYIKESAHNISKQERKDVFDRVKAILVQKISFVVNKGIDNILISLFMGIVSVGYYTNYNLIVTTIGTIIYQIFSSMTASVGNLLTENNINKNYRIYKNINMMNSFITGIAVVGFSCAITPFVKVWLGDKYLLSEFIVISFAIYIYAEAIRRTNTLFKEAAGICKEDKFMYIIMAFINLVLSVVLCKLIGMSGVILGTAISYLFLMYYSYPKYVYKALFNKNYKDYLVENLRYLLHILVSFVCSYSICKMILIKNNIIQLMVCVSIAIAIPTILFIVIFRKQEEFKYFVVYIKKILNKVFKRKRTE